MKKSTTLIAVVFIILVVGLGWFLYKKTPATSVNAPENEQSVSWNDYTNSQYGFEMKYPAGFFDENQMPKLLAGECSSTGFPGKCPDIKDIVANDLISQGGDAKIIKSNLSDQNYWDNPEGTKQTINNVDYCLYTTGDAATGHAFNYYYFATVKNDKCLVVYLSTSTENCDFYLPLEEGNTEQKQSYDNCIKTNQEQPQLLNQIISTFKFSK